MSNEVILLWLYLGGSVLVACLGVPLWLGRVPPNWYYGYRTRRTVLQPKVWYAVNRVTGLWCLLIGLSTAIVSILVYLLEIPTPVGPIMMVGPVLVCLVGLLVHANRVASSIERANADEHPVS